MAKIIGPEKIVDMLTKQAAAIVENKLNATIFTTRRGLSFLVVNNGLNRALYNPIFGLFEVAPLDVDDFHITRAVKILAFDGKTISYADNDGERFDVSVRTEPLVGFGNNVVLRNVLTNEEWVTQCMQKTVHEFDFDNMATKAVTRRACYVSHCGIRGPQIDLVEHPMIAAIFVKLGNNK